MSRPSLETVNYPEEADMEATAIFVAISVAILVAILLPLFLSRERWRAAENRARARVVSLTPG
jgi:hypothetical protein